MTKEEYINLFMKDFEETKKYSDELGIRVYLAAEIRFTENNNDYLVFGVNREMLEEIYDLLPCGVENFRNEYSMHDSVFIQAHPMRDGMVSVDPSILDGIEVFNMHPHHNSRIGLASVYARKHDHFIITAGSDFHHSKLNHEGLSAVRSSYLPEDTFALAKLLKNGEYLLEIGRDNFVLL